MAVPRPNIVRIVFFTLIFFLALSWPIHHWGGWPWFKSYALGYFCSLLNIVFSLVSIRWGFRKRVRVFYTVVLGGMAVRFLFFALVLLVLIKWLSWPLSGFLFSFLVFYLFLQYHEIKMINSELASLKTRDL